MLVSEREAEIAQTIREFCEDWRYPQTLPGPDGGRAVMLLQYLAPGLDLILGAHYAARGWRRHNDLAEIKPRRIIGGAFPDLITYVPVDEPDTPLVAEHDPATQLEMWSVTPTLTETFEERPADD